MSTHSIYQFFQSAWFYSSLLFSLFWLYTICKIVYLFPRGRSYSWKQGKLQTPSPDSQPSAYPPFLDYREMTVVVVGKWILWSLIYVLLYPVLTVKSYKYEETYDRISETDKPYLILCNHLSFLDAFVFLASAPDEELKKLKSSFAGSLFQKPFMGTILQMAGHLPLFYKKPLDNDSFSLENTDQIHHQFRNLLSRGGCLGLFPEGKINVKNPEVLLPFRYGGLRYALEYNLPIYSCLFAGTGHFWSPSQHSIRKTTIHQQFDVIDSRGAQDYLVDQTGNSDILKDPEAHKVLADLLRVSMQKKLDELLEKINTDE